MLKIMWMTELPFQHSTKVSNSCFRRSTYTDTSKFLFQVTQELGIEPPIPVSMKSKDLNNVFSRIIWAAEHPHLNIPETETGRNRKRYRHLVNSSLVFVSGVLVLLLYFLHMHTWTCIVLITVLHIYSWGCCCGRRTGCLSSLCCKKEFL